MKGFGTVITGTAISGSLSIGDARHHLPPGNSGKVRGIQVHNQDTEQVRAACARPSTSRVLKKPLSTGATWWPRPRGLRPTILVDARIRLLRSAERP